MGYTRDIEETDLYAPLPEHRSDNLGNAVQRAWDKEMEHSRANRNYKPSLYKVLIKVFGTELMLYGLILAAMEFIIRLQQPLFLGTLLRYYTVPQNSTTNHTYINRLFHYYDMEGAITWGEAVFCAFGVIFCSAINVLVQHPFMMGVMHIGMKMRVGICSLIYRKALKVNLQTQSEYSAGLVMNLMANDVNRFDTGPLFVHYLWIGPIEMMIVGAYLYREMQLAAVYGAAFMFAVIPFQIFLGVRTAHYRKATAIKSDERVRLMKEIIMGIEVIKMYTWEAPFREIIDTVRRQEIFNIKMTSMIRGVIMSFIMFTSRFGIFITVLFYVKFVSHITVENVFFLTCFYNIIKQTMTLYFPQAVGQIAEMIVAIQRIRDYLLSEECNLPPRERPDLVSIENARPKKHVFVVDPSDPDALERRRMSSNLPSTSQITSKDKRKDQTVISFEEASSHWLVSSGKEDVENITFMIPAGTLNMVVGAVGSGKSTLLHMILRELPCSSGRVEVSGTVSYASQDPWLFVGSVRQNILFGQQFVKSRYMEVCKVCALERDISLFPHGDKTVIGERGVSLSGGQRARINLARAVYKEADIYLFDDPLSAVDTQVANQIFQKCIKRYLDGKTVILVTHQIQFIKSVENIIIMNKGQIVAQGGFEELNEQELNLIQMMKEKTKEVREEDSIVLLPSVSTTNPSTASAHRNLWSLTLQESVADQRPQAETQVIGRVSTTVYRDYFLAGAACPYVTVVCFMFILAQVCASTCDYWISRWSQAEDTLTGDAKNDAKIWHDQGLTRDEFVLIFGVITIATIGVALLRAFFFFSLCMRSSIKLHDKMFECVSQSPMSFFHINPSGRILNRFSKDMGSVDELLPQAMIDCFQILLNLIGVSAVILLSDVALLIPTAAAMMIFYILRVIYIRTSGAVKRLEGISIFQWGMRQSAEMENQMTSVERVLEYTHLPREPTLKSTKDNKPPKEWPYEGAVEFTNLSLKYTLEGMSVLHKLNLNIAPQEKIGIVGRTGAGKSSVIQALFRLAYLEGTITIDGIDTATISLHDLRERLSIIPQEPVLFSGNMRKNLDPFDQYPDDVLLKALSAVELIDIREGALDKTVAEGGSNFSVGERQLVCLARAIVRNNKVLVLDEATANVDAQTDALIQTAIRKHFMACTVLTIAHRLNTVIDSTRILVLDGGKLIEFNHPHILLQNRRGAFSRMVAETGSSMAQTLHKLAEESYNNMNEEPS
ncbi:probable multidrug resistance-associated protein lethal(2)03659 isoform X4 [Hyposmocoma kahamanoa]|uniref:probable multidrug resistance-associated protein lethal(2)03659 isoform X4 n=1 Tax=Hyposmocoma kahamanoa TaxID=1477025 RepID=UPI000E6D602D|nr:probable multidrug resistance-associated protein lethal(2)03659 isoform X4 [Hyposmocoma kahamanoa]